MSCRDLVRLTRKFISKGINSYNKSVRLDKNYYVGCREFKKLVKENEEAGHIPRRHFIVEPNNGKINNISYQYSPYTEDIYYRLEYK